MSSGVKVQAKGTTLATRSFCAARAGTNGAASGRMALAVSASIRLRRDTRLIDSSQGSTDSIALPEIIAEMGRECHAAGRPCRLTAFAQLDSIAGVQYES